MEASLNFELLGHRLKSISYNESVYDEWLRKEFADVPEGGEVTVKFGVSVSVEDPSLAEGKVDGKQVVEINLTFIISIASEDENDEITALTMSFVAGFLHDNAADIEIILKEFEKCKVSIQRAIYWAVRPMAAQIMNQTLLKKVFLPWDAIHDRVIADFKEVGGRSSKASRKKNKKD